MLREYKKGDELLLNCSEFSVGMDVRNCVENCGYKAKTFENKNAILCIVLYYKYAQDHYATFSLVSRDIKFNELRQLKKEIAKASKDGGAKTFLTFCNKDGKLDRWHKFMGYKKCRNELSGKAKNLSRWILIWD